MGRVGIHHSTRMVSSGSFCFLVVLVPVLGVPLPTPDPLNIHIHLDEAMKKGKESAVKHEGAVNPPEPDWDPESEDLNEMNIGSIGNVLGNVNDAGSGSDTMHQGPGGTSMFSGGGSFGGGNHFSMQSGGGSFGRGSGSGSGFGFNSGLENQESFGAFRSGGNFRRRSSGFGGGSFGGGSFDGGNSNNLFSSGGSSSGGNNNNLFSSGGGMMGSLNSLTGGFGSGGGTQIVGGAQSASGTNVNQNNIG